MKKITNLLFLLLSSSVLIAQSVLIEPTGISPVLGGGGNALTDADANTRIEVEKTNNEDKIRFTAGGKEIAVLDSQAFNLNAKGESVFIGLGAGEIDEGEHLAGGYYNNENVGIGNSALKNNTSGHYNSVMGYMVLFANTSGSRNSAVGYKSLYSNTSGGYNSALGLESLYSNTTGTGNTAVGAGSLYSNKDKDGNTGIGHSALYHNYSGGMNTAIGRASLYNNASGNNNSAVGRSALYYNTNGADNVGLGWYSLFHNVSGSKNVAVGREAGRTDSIGHNNVYIGFQTGGGTASPLTNRSGNVFLGYKAGFQEIGSDKLYIENSDSDEPLIYGDFDEDQLKINGTLAVRDETRLKGYTTIGDHSDAPKIKTKMLYATTDGTASLSIAHGVSGGRFKVISANIFIDGGVKLIPPNHPTTAINYAYRVSDNNIDIQNIGTTLQVIGSAVQVLITYME